MYEMSVYLLQVREFIKTGEPIYKVGRSGQENTKRIDTYPKGSQLLLFFKCMYIPYNKLERIILAKFKAEYVQRRDIGLEYFEGNIDDMRRLFNQIAFEHDIKNNEDIKNDKVKEVKNADGIDDFFDQEITDPANLIENCGWSDLIITNRKNMEGILRFKNSNAWYKFSDKSEEDLKLWIEVNLKEGTITDNIYKKLLEANYRSDIVLYIPEYNIITVLESVDGSNNVYELDCKFQTITKIKNDQYFVLKRGYSVGRPTVENAVGMSFKLELVDDLVRSYVTNATYINQFKAVCRGIFVKRNNCKLVSYTQDATYILDNFILWACDECFGIEPRVYVKPQEKIPLDKNKIRFVILHGDVTTKKKKMDLFCPSIEHKNGQNIYNISGLLSCVHKNIQFFPKYKNTILKNFTSFDVKIIFESLLYDMVMWSSS